MNFNETAALLAKIALVDNREADRNVALYWADLLHDVDFHDAVQAVAEHRRTSTEYLVPAHVVLGVQRSREARWEAFGGQVDYDRLKSDRIDPELLHTDPRRYRTETHALREAILSGTVTRTDLKEIEA